MGSITVFSACDVSRGIICVFVFAQIPSKEIMANNRVLHVR